MPWAIARFVGGVAMAVILLHVASAQIPTALDQSPAGEISRQAGDVANPH